MRTDDTHWTMELWVQDPTPRLGLGPYQHRADGAAVTPRHLVCFADALWTPGASRVQVHKATGHVTRLLTARPRRLRINSGVCCGRTSSPICKRSVMVSLCSKHWSGFV
jgi:hypothetical protein